MELSLSCLPSLPVIWLARSQNNCGRYCQGRSERKCLGVLRYRYYYVSHSISQMSSPTSFTRFILEAEITVLGIFNRSLEERYLQFYIISYVYTTLVCFGRKIWRFVHYKRISERLVESFSTYIIAEPTLTNFLRS